MVQEVFKDINVREKFKFIILLDMKANMKFLESNINNNLDFPSGWSGIMGLAPLSTSDPLFV